MSKKLILASGSPRRRELLSQHGIKADIMPVDVDENIDAISSAKEAVMFLALKKALCASKHAAPGTLIIAADTVVNKNGIMGKPKDISEAEEMLMRINGTDHEVMTGIAVIETGTDKKEVLCDITKVFCKKYTKKEIDEYIATGEPFDKAGAYAIQGAFGKYVDRIEGNYETVVGLPVDVLVRLIKERFGTSIA